MNLIDGKRVAGQVLEEIRQRVEKLASRGIQPGIAVILVGDDPASQAYVRNKERTSLQLGFLSKSLHFPKITSQEEVLKAILALNEDPLVHGILVQSPPPPHIDESALVRAIDPRKDVDGFHPVNVAKLVMEDPTGFIPCTPLGCQRLLLDAGIETAGAEVVIVGRSMIVGKPLALLLMRKGAGGDATVTLAHSRTPDLAKITQRADIVIAALGRPQFLGADHIRKGAVVIDVGINRVEDSAASRGYRLEGDVDFVAVAEKCKAITPVPGGVGPMTIAMLLQNTVTACERLYLK